MTEKIKQFSKDSVVPISVGLLIMVIAGLAGGVWTLAAEIQKWEFRLGEIERKIGSRWSYYMERKSWDEFQRDNPGVKIPDIKEIRDDFSGVFN